VPPVALNGLPALVKPKALEEPLEKELLIGIC
jgi:hypothetical protein